MQLFPRVIHYLRTHTFRELEEAHGVCARPNVGFDKFSLNYDQIQAKSGDPLSEECRGLIVRPAPGVVDDFLRDAARTGCVPAAQAPWRERIVGDVEVLAWPMCRFYNFGDSAVAPVDWSDPSLRVYEKVDGTCIICYWDPLHGRWHAATRSVPEADLPIRGGDLEIGDMTFAELFLKALVATREETSGLQVTWNVDGPDKVIHLNKETTYVFELVSRYNQIVVDYPEPRVYLLAARHLPTGRELLIDSIRMEHVRRPRTWPLNNAAAVSAFVNSANPSELEGAVVCDSRFRRMKIKSTGYVLAHRCKDTVTSSPRNALEAIILEKIDDVVPLVPKDVGEKMLQMQAGYARMCREIDAAFTTYKEVANGSRKEFAAQVTASGFWPVPFFQMLDGRATSTQAWLKALGETGRLPASMLDTIASKIVSAASLACGKAVNNDCGDVRIDERGS